MAQLSVVHIENNGGGVDAHERPDKIGPSYMTDESRNVRLDGMRYGPRKGYISFANEKTGGSKVHQVSVYDRNLAADDRLIMFYNNKIWSIEPESESTWTEISQSYITDGTNINTVSFGDWLFVFNGVDRPIRVAGSTASQPFTKPDSLTAANFVPAFGEIYNGSLFVAGVPTAPNTVFISKVSTSASQEDVYDFSGSLNTYGSSNELLFKSRVTAIKKLSDALVIFTIDEAYYVPGIREFGSSVTFNIQPIGGSQGAVSHKSTSVVENDIYYLTPQKEIRSIRRGFSDTLSMITTPLSEIIQDFLDESISQSYISNSFSVYNPIEKEYHLVYTKDGDSSNTMRIVADISKLDQSGVPMFMIDDNTPFASGVVYNGTTYCGSSAIGQLYKVNVGTADDDDANIVAKRVSKSYNGSNPITLKKFKGLRLYGEMTTNSSEKVEVYVDDKLVKESSITSSDIPSATNAGGGIGTQSIADFQVGDETESDYAGTSRRFSFRKDIPIRARGYELKYIVTSDGKTNDYLMGDAEYSMIPTSRLTHPIIEK